MTVPYSYMKAFYERKRIEDPEWHSTYMQKKRDAARETMRRLREKRKLENPQAPKKRGPKPKPAVENA